jgi:glycosyltransferase involved in cell wall biosynthesis
MKTESDEPLISVIVPVYGVEKYINKCLDSIINQTYENLEIILVDDGSKDSSGRICDEYALKDERIRVFHKSNGGLSDARNFGIEQSTGEFITFIDSDDYIDLDYIEFLYHLIKKGYDLAVCSLHVVYTSNGHVCDKGNGREIVVSGKKCIEMMCYHDEVDTCAYAKLAHRRLFSKVRYPKGKLFEDIGTTYLLFDQCDKIICSFVPKYYYVIRENSIVTSSFNLHKLDLIEMTNQMARYVDEKYPEIKDATLRRRGYAYFSTLNQMLDVKENEYIEIRKKIIKFLKRNSFDIIKNSHTPMRDKVAYLSLNCGFPIYKFLWKSYIKYQRG